MIMGTVRARRIDVQRITAEAAALDYSDAGQYPCQSAHHGRFGCAFLATYQHAAHLWGNGGQDQGEGHVPFLRRIIEDKTRC